MRRLLACSLLAAGCAVGSAAAERPGTALPPLTGDLAGRLTLPSWPGWPELAWRVELSSPAPDGLRFEATASAPGLELRLALTPPRGSVAGSWRIVAASIDAATWWRLAAGQAGLKSLPADLELTGRLMVTGAGEWRERDFTGTLQAALAGGTARNASQHWSAEAISLGLELALVPAGPVIREVQLRAGTVQFGAVTARELALDAAGSEGGRLAVSRAEVRVLGGRFALAPFTLDPAAPAVRSAVDFSGVALSEIAALVPQAVKVAQGQIAGRISLDWSLRTGLGPGDVAVEIAPGTPATVGLAPSPGLLSGNSPPRIALLPAFLGPLRSWFSFANPAHQLLRHIELGETPLAVERLSVQLYPDGAGGERSLNLKFTARPVGQTEVVDQVSFNINVSGPLDQVIRLGLDDRARIRLESSK